MSVYKILKYLAFVVGGIATVLFFWLLAKGDDAVTSSADLQDSILNPFLYLTYFVLGLTVVSVLVFVVSRLFTENVKGTLIGIGGFLLIFLIAFFAADSEGYDLPNGTHVSGQLSQWVDTGLIMFYILAVVAVLVLIASSFKKLTFRN